MPHEKKYLSPSTLSSLHRAPSVSALTNFSLQEARMSWQDKDTWLSKASYLARTTLIACICPSSSGVKLPELSTRFTWKRKGNIENYLWHFRQLLCHTMLCFSSSWLTPCPRSTITPVGNVCNCRGRPAWNGEAYTMIIQCVRGWCDIIGKNYLIKLSIQIKMKICAPLQEPWLPTIDHQGLSIQVLLLCSPLEDSVNIQWPLEINTFEWHPTLWLCDYVR